jgi:hypothetical protein
MAAGSRIDFSIGLQTMQHFQQHTRRQWCFAIGAIALLGAIAVVPSRVIAQEEKIEGKAAVTAPAAKAPAKADDQTKTSEPPQNSGRDRGSFREGRGGARGGWQNGNPAAEEARKNLEKLLVGVWRGGRADGDLMFNAGGVFNEFPQTLTRGTQTEEGNVQGRWSLSAGVQPSLRLEVDMAGVSLRGLPGRRESANSTNFEIILLDENFLRLREMSSSGRVAFFRRVAEPAERPQFADDLPDSIRRLAALAELSPADAAALAAPEIDWLKEWQVSDAQLKLIERVALARRGKLDLAELFELSKEEAAAYAELYQLTQANFKAIGQLADKEQLTPLELTTVKKLRAARDEFERGIGAMKLGTAKIRLGQRDVAPKLDESTLQALGKLYPALDRLAEFPNATVFTEPAENPPRVGRFRGE